MARSRTDPGAPSDRARSSSAESPERERIEKEARERLRRSGIDAAHFFGLAALYEERGKHEQAAECLQIALQKDVVNPYAHKLQGKIFFRRKSYNAAATELQMARRYNPFDRETAEILGRVEYERERYRDALEATIDAFLLLKDDDRDNAERLKKRIRTLKAIQKVSSQDLVQLFRERRDKLQTAFDRLEWQRERLLRQEDTVSIEAKTEPVPIGGQLLVAGRLRHLELWTELSDDQVFHLSRAAREEVHPEGTTIFAYGDIGRDIYALEQGEIAIRRPTHYGTYRLGTLNPGAIFGEVNFLSHAERSGTAVATSECHLLRLDAEELEVVIRNKPDLGVQLYSIFFRSLARKLRDANEQLRTFFAAEAERDAILHLRQTERTRTDGQQVDIHADDKMEVLREQGLDGVELTTMAKFSDVKQFPAGAYLFHEGDAGQEMYVVLEGEVMISKYIAGGEEALAILRRGEFFGEMALIDSAPRSADAKAHQGPATVIAFDDETLREVMAMEAAAALDFMKLLCQLIAKRLREIDEKVTGWRIMSGDRPEEINQPAAAS